MRQFAAKHVAAPSGGAHVSRNTAQIAAGNLPSAKIMRVQRLKIRFWVKIPDA
jgi:hypothetical protein